MIVEQSIEHVNPPTKINFRPLTAQQRILVRHFQRGMGLTQLEAIGVYNMYRLPARVFELKDKGYNVQRVLKTDPTGKRYAKYFIPVSN